MKQLRTLARDFALAFGVADAGTRKTSDEETQLIQLEGLSQAGQGVNPSLSLAV